MTAPAAEGCLGDNDGPNLTFLRALRVLKSARILRLVRVVRFLRELRLMLDCIINSVFHLVWSVIIIVLILLMYALLIVQGLNGYVEIAPPEHRERIEKDFSTVATAMVSLFMATTGGQDWEEQYFLISAVGSHFRVVYLIFIAFFIIVAWNTVMGSFVEKACRLAMPDLEQTAMEKHQEQQAYAKELSKMFYTKLDQNHDGGITLREFKDHLQDPEVVSFFLARDINVTDAEMFFHMLSSIHGADKVNIKTFTKAILRLRGNASAIDMQAFHFDLKCMAMESTLCLHKLTDLFERILYMATIDDASSGKPPLPNFGEHPVLGKLEDLIAKLASVHLPNSDPREGRENTVGSWWDSGPCSPPTLRPHVPGGPQTSL